MIRLYDSVYRQVRDFVPLYERRIGIYVCGLSVQRELHVPALAREGLDGGQREVGLGRVAPRARLT